MKLVIIESDLVEKHYYNDNGCTLYYMEEVKKIDSPLIKQHRVVAM